MEHRLEEDVLEVLREEGRLLLAHQALEKADALRGTESLLRLGVAAFAGILALVGIMVTLRLHLDLVAIFGFGGAVVAATLGSLALAVPLAGARRSWAFTVGPDIGQILEESRVRPIDRHALVGGVVYTLPAWLERNEGALRRLDAWRLGGLVGLIVAAIFLLGTLAYMVGG